MPFYLGLPVVGDLQLNATNTDIQLGSGPEAVRQSIQTRALIFKGSWRYDRTKGVPYFQEILVSGAQVELVRRRFYEMIAGTPGVVSVAFVRLRFDTESATMYVDFDCVAESGTVTGTLDFQVVS
jgi:hypothetical protein